MKRTRQDDNSQEKDAKKVKLDDKAHVLEFLGKHKYINLPIALPENANWQQIATSSIPALTKQLEKLSSMLEQDGLQLKNFPDKSINIGLVPQFKKTRTAELHQNEAPEEVALDKSIPLGSSKLGGYPQVPKDCDTVEYDDMFLAQVRVKDVQNCHLVKHMLPATGILLAFGSEDESGKIVHCDCNDQTVFKVLTPGSEDEEVELDSRVMINEPENQITGFEERLSMAPYDVSFDDEEDREKFSAFVDRDESQYFRSYDTMFFGHPSGQQGETAEPNDCILFHVRNPDNRDVTMWWSLDADTAAQFKYDSATPVASLT